MSGDVQPRKRKDKRRKKDDTPGHEEPSIQAAAPTGNEDFNIHVHNDHGTGGGICAKLVFFVLLSVLAVLIGMIFIEKRGLTDLDTAPTQSRFANIFDGWIETEHDDDHHEHIIKAIEGHDEHEAEEASLEEGHDDDEHEEDHDEEHEDHDEEHEETEEQVSEEEHENDEQGISEEEQQEASEEAEEEQEEVSEEAEEEDEQQISEEVEEEAEEGTQEESQEVSEEEQQETEEEVEEQHESEEQVSEEKQEEEEDEIPSVADDVEENELQISEEQTDDDHAEDINENNEQEDDDNTAEGDEDNTSNPEEENNDDENDFDTVSQENEIFEEDSVENPAEIEGDDQEEEVIDNTAGEEEVLKVEAEKQEEAEQEESSSMAVKFGVGVALVVVAHVVLVRKWRSGKSDDKSNEEEVVTDLSRRNTIVPPAPLELIENEIQNLDEDEYSEEEIEESDEEIIIEPVPVKKNYQELHSTYSRTLPPENLTKTTFENLNTPPKRTVYYPRSADEEEEVEEEQEEDDKEVEDEEEIEEDEDVEEGDEGEEPEEEEISDVDDEELLKKLEARYGKLPSSKDNQVDEKEKDYKFSSWKKIKVLPDAEDSEGSEDEHWTKQDSVPADIKQRLDLAEKNLRENSDLAYTLFTNLMAQLPNNNRIKYGRAQALDLLAEQKRSNQFLQDTISSYYDLLQSPTISDKLYLKVAERCIDRMRFRGHYNKAVQVHKEIINRFPNNPSHRNQLAVTLLTSNRLSLAKLVLQEVLNKWPDDGFALAHYGFILKTKDNNMKLAVEYLRRGIESRVLGVIDGRFYFHLGDALQRLGRNEEAMNVYEDGVKHNVFLSKYQRSLYNINRLTGQPWWPLNQTPYETFFKILEDKWKKIREEGLALLNKSGYFKDEAENLRDTGKWKQFELFARGQKLVENCRKCPQTCSLIENFPDAKGCRRGQVKFSVMHPGTHVWPHCGPSNCRLRAHLGLKIPSNTFIRVAEETRSWSEGKIFLFDDSFEHEVWHNGSDVRLVLIVDVWHPELTAHEKQSLPAI